MRATTSSLPHTLRTIPLQSERNGSHPAGYEGILTQRGATSTTFTDGDFVLNQSRLFTVGGGDITMWSSNGDLNAGQGAKTTPNFPPVDVRFDEDLVSREDQAGSTSGAGIAGLPPGRASIRPTSSCSPHAARSSQAMLV